MIIEETPLFEMKNIEYVSTTFEFSFAFKILNEIKSFSGHAPKVHLTSTHIKALQINPYDVLHPFDDTNFSNNP
jgi:hypothetical protein